MYEVVLLGRFYMLVPLPRVCCGGFINPKSYPLPLPQPPSPYRRRRCCCWDDRDASAISMSLFLIVMVSVLLGSALPFGFARAGVDPAHAGTSIQARLAVIFSIYLLCFFSMFSFVCMLVCHIVICLFLCVVDYLHLLQGSPSGYGWL